VPLISTEQNRRCFVFRRDGPDMRLGWQEFLIRMVANAFGLPPLMLGLEADVNQSTASEMTDEAFRGAISPLAMCWQDTLPRSIRQVHWMAGIRVCLQRFECEGRRDGAGRAGGNCCSGGVDCERGAGDEGVWDRWAGWQAQLAAKRKVPKPGTEGAGTLGLGLRDFKPGTGDGTHPRRVKGADRLQS